MSKSETTTLTDEMPPMRRDIAALTGKEAKIVIELLLAAGYVSEATLAKSIEIARRIAHV